MGDGGAAVRLNQIQHGSAKMPVTVWNNMAIPEISSTSNELLSSTSSSWNRTFEITALHPELVCQLIGKHNIYHRTMKADEDGTYHEDPNGNTTFSYARPLLDPSCQLGSVNGRQDHHDFIAGIAGWETHSESIYAALNDFYLGPWPTLLVLELDDSENARAPWGGFPYNYSEVPDGPVGCPSIGIGVLGQSTSEDLNDRLSAFLCSQKIARKRLRVAYSSTLDGKQKMSTEISLVVLDGPAECLTDGTEGVDSFPYRPEEYFATNLTYFGDRTYSVVDRFFEHVIDGPNGTSIENLIGKANRENLLRAVQQLYGKYMSLVIDAKFRQPFPAGTPQEDRTVNGTATYFTSRLQVDYGSKLALQILLGLMTLFAALAFGLSDLRGTLPRKPTSIASVMALLAGSDLVNDGRLRPENLQGRSVEEVLDGEIFSLGWWPVKDKDVQNEEQRSDEESTSREGNHEAARETSKRFGIDIGVPEQLGLRETRAWRLRQRLRQLGRRGK